MLFAFVMVVSASLWSSSAAQGPNRPASDDKNIRAILAPLDGATSIRQDPVQVAYDLAIPYPGQGIVEQFNERFVRAGWRRLKEDVSNPGLPTSESAGWVYFIDGRTKPEKRLSQWIDEWASPGGDVVILGLTYRAATAEPDARPLPSLHVGERYMSAAIVERAELHVPGAR